jgi:hypothetical protein
MNCIITIKGNGSGRHGNPKTPRTGPVSGFLIDNNVFYIAVTEHLKTCDTCNIEDILRVYLERRKKTPKFNGVTSSGLVKRALILENLAAKKGSPIPKELVNEFIWRSIPSHDTLEEFGRLSPREKFLSYRLSIEVISKTDIPWNFENWVRSWVSIPQNKILAKLAYDSRGRRVVDEEIEELIRVAEVVYS